MSVDNLVNKALDRIGKVHPVIKQGAEEIIRRAYKQDLYVLFSDGYRSHAQQNALYAQGRTKPGNIVTNARGGQSLHNYGLALDMFITNKKGTSASWNVKELTRAAKIAKSLGFEWGGDWKNFKDYPHIQMTGGLSLADLQAGKKPDIKLKNDVIKQEKKKTTKKKSAKKKSNNSKPGKEPTIKNVQLKLNRYKVNNIVVDGILGPKTKKAMVKAYQYELNRQFNAGLIVDGIPGPKTDNAAVTLRYNKTKGNLAKLTQGMLILHGYKTAFDGYWQGDSINTTKKFQKDKGLAVDGVPGKATYKKLVR